MKYSLLEKQFRILLFDQFLISLNSFAITTIAYNFLNFESLSNFVFIWAIIWGLVAILNENVVNPVRINSGSDSHNTSGVQQGINTRIFLFYVGFSTMICGSFIPANLDSHDFFLCLSTVSLYTSLSIKRNTLLDDSKTFFNLFYSSLILSINLMGLCLISKWQIMEFRYILILYCLSLAIVQIENVFQFRVAFIGMKQFVNIIKENIVFGLTTFMRIVLFSLLTVTLLRLYFPNVYLINFGLIMSLSTPGLLLCSTFNQYSFARLRVTRTGNIEFLNYLRISVKLLFLACLGTLGSVLLAILLSIMSRQYNHLISNFGNENLVCFLFMVISTVALSGLVSSILQIHGKSKIHFYSILTGGFLGIICLFALPPLMISFTPYFFYICSVLFLNLLQGRKHE